MSIWAPVCNSLGNDLGGSCILVDLGSAWVVVSGHLNVEARVCCLVESESHQEHWRRSGGGVYPVDQEGVEFYVHYGGPGRRIAIDLVIVDGADLVRHRFVAFAGFGGVVLLATFDTHGPVGRALSGSSFSIGPFVG